MKAHGLKKFFSAYVMIGSYVLCVSTHDKSAYIAITFHLLEMSSTTTLNQTILNVPTRYIFQRVFLGKISTILPICIMKKVNLEVLCKWNRFCYWNSCKSLANFINVAALIPALHTNILFENRKKKVFKI